MIHLAYTVSNEDLAWTTSISQPRDMRVLTTAGSGDQALFYTLAGAWRIDTFDICEYARLIQDIKTAIIPLKNRREYIEIINGLHTARAGDVAKITGMADIATRIGPDSAKILKSATDMGIAPFTCGSSIKSYPTHIPDELYYGVLQRKLRHPFNFIHTDLDSLHTKISGKYDLIDLSNIFDWGYDDARMAQTLGDLARHVNLNGKIVFNTQKLQAPDYTGTYVKIPSENIELHHTRTAICPSDKNIRMMVFQRTR